MRQAWRAVVGWLLLILTGCTLTIQPPTPVPAVEDSLVQEDVFTLNRRLGRGINFGNALEAPVYEGEWGLRLREEYFAVVAAAGFDSVRVPIRWSAHARKSEPYTIDPRFFERIDWVVEQALAHDLLIILDLHHMTEMMAGPDLYQPFFLALWAQIAERYRDAPPEVIFELLNEPHDRLTAEKWNEILPAAIALIRQTNPTRAIIVGPTQWNNIHQLPTLQLPADDRNLIVTFHYYDPFQFTHQGAEWVAGSNAWLGTTWTGSEAQQREITNAFDRAVAWAEREGRPLFLGEFGAYSRADLDSRARWTAFVARTAEQRGISWAYWEFGASFGAYELARADWNAALIEALVPAERE
jgi:endoglucanase